jgi:transcriptional regulator with XRE-family HTH domain
VSPASPYLRARHERQRRDLTLKALALLSGLTTAEISLIETGRLTPTPAQLEKLARAFGIRNAVPVRLAVTAIAALVRSAIVRAGSANAAVLPDGESFTALDVYTAVTCKSVGTMTTATSFNVTIVYLANEGTHAIH